MATPASNSADSGPEVSQLLRQRITQAQQQPAHAQALRLCAQRYVTRHRHANTDLDTRKIANFIDAYLSLLPDMIDEFNHCCLNVNWSTMVNKLHLSVHKLMLKKFHFQETHWSLLEWLDKCYVIHRLIEEAHDHIWCAAGRPLLTWNMTAANLVVYDVIGEKHAKHLEAAVQEMTELFLSEFGPPPTQALNLAQGQWRCLFSHYQQA